MKPRSAESYYAVRRGHSRLVTVTLHNLNGVIGEVPIHGGYVGFDLSRSRGIRYGLLEVPGHEFFDLFDPRYVTWVTVSFAIEGETWDLGEFPVRRVEVEKPGGMVMVDLQDWVFRRSRHPATSDAVLSSGTTLAGFFEHYMRTVMPSGIFDVTLDETFGAAKPYSPKVPAGGDVWTGMRKVAEDSDAYFIVTSMTTGEVRRYDPYQPFHDDLDGTVNRSRVGWDMDEVINRVVARISSEEPDGGTFVGTRAVSGGNVLAYTRDGIGFHDLVESDSVPVASQAIADARTNRLYDRRVGAVRRQRLRVVPQPWLEPGDVVSWDRLEIGSGEDGCIESIEYPLRADGVMLINTRGIPVI